MNDWAYMQIEHSDFQDQLVRGLAHRMNNILTLFHGYVGLLMDNKKLDKATTEGLARMKEGARAASDLMDRTHSLVRPSKVVWREVELGNMLRLLTTNFETMCGPEGTVELHCPDHLPLIWADMGRIKTAIVEIVRNACQANPPGGVVRIDVRAEQPPTSISAAQQPIKWISVTVTDNGPGIPEDAHEKIYAPFFSSKKAQTSAGLGLTVALGFIQQHGGVLRFESEPGRTAFQILLPSRSEQG